MKVALLTSNERFKSEIDLVNLFFDHGLDVLHLKKRKFSKSRLNKYLQQIPKQHLNKIIIHQHYWLAVKYRLKGVHLGKKERQHPMKTRVKIFFLKLLHPKLQICTSFHSVQSALTDKKTYHHVLLSPVFDSVTKLNYSSAFSENQLQNLFDNTTHNYFALGGIDEDQIDFAKIIGFKGVLLYGSIWKAGNQKLNKFLRIKQKAAAPLKQIPEVNIKAVKIKM